MAASLAALTDAELRAAERTTHAAAVAAFLEVTADGREATKAEQARVNRLNGAWERVLDEHERRGLHVEVPARAAA